MTNTTRTATVLTLLSLVAGCSDERSPTAPTALQSATQPAPPASLPTQPTVTAIIPSAGSDRGGAWGVITGENFLPGATVALGSGPVVQVSFQDSTAIKFWTASHTAGPVDVVVTNPGGLSSTLPGGFTFAAPASFDFNGDWIAHAGPEFETDMRFIVRNDQLVSLSCDGVPLRLSAPVTVQGGEVSVADATGVAMTGTLVSPVNAVGTIDVPWCPSSRWWAVRSGE